MTDKPSYEALEERLAVLEKAASADGSGDHAPPNSAAGSEELSLLSRNLFGACPDGIVITDRDGRILDCNRSFLELLGYTKQDLLNRTLLDITPRRYHQSERESMQPALITGGFFAYEKELINQSGTFLPVSIFGWFLNHDAAGNVDRIGVFVKDISERKQAEKHIYESQLRYRELVESMPSGVVVYEAINEGSEFVFKEFNRAAEQIEGVQRGNVIGMGVTRVFPGVKAFGLFDVFQRVWRTGKAEAFPLAVYQDDRDSGSHRENHVYKLPSGEIVAVYNDVSERIKAQKSLEAREEKYRVVAEFAYDWEYWRGPDGMLQYVAPSCERITGYGEDEFFSDPDLVHTLVYPEDRTLWQGHFKEAFQGKPFTGALDYRIVTKDGKIRWIEHHCDTVFDVAGNWLGRRVSNRDITDRKEMEAALTLNEERLDALLKLHTMKDESAAALLEFALEEAVRITKSQVGYLHRLNPDGQTIALNAWSKNTLQLCAAEKPGHYPLEQAGIWADCARMRKPVVHNDYFSCPHKKGFPPDHLTILRHMSVPVFEEDRIVAIVGVGNKEAPYDDADVRQLTLFTSSVWDILGQKRHAEEKEKLERQLRQIQKMEAMGALAGGIAHDFNNILVPLLGFTELLKDDLPSDSPHQVAVEEMLHASLRAKELVNQILTFSRQTEKNSMPLDMRLVIREVINLIRSSLPATIKIEQDISSTYDLVLADPTHIHQIVMNLVTNASHAMEASGGTLTIGLRNQIVAEKEATHLAVNPGPYVVLSITDTGSGMDAETVEKIFDPYFTTKPPAKGTGLGLAVVRSIVQSYRGGIRLQSDVGHGTRFDVHLPAIEPDHQLAEQLAQSTVQGGNERILLVDDEAPIARLEKQILERMGYRVQAYTSSMEALAAFNAAPVDFDAVITDMTMPEMTGDVLAEALMRIRPDIPVIICTGFSEKMNSEKAKMLGLKGFIMKPVIRSEIAEILRKALDGG